MLPTVSNYVQSQTALPYSMLGLTTDNNSNLRTHKLIAKDAMQLIKLLSAINTDTFCMAIPNKVDSQT